MRPSRQQREEDGRLAPDQALSPESLQVCQWPRNLLPSPPSVLRGCEHMVSQQLKLCLTCMDQFTCPSSWREDTLRLACIITVREEAEAGQRAGASAQPPESPGVYRSLRKRPNLNYAQAAGEYSPPLCSSVLSVA